MTHFIKASLLSLLFLLCANPIQANAPEELSRLLANFQSMQADFTQTVYDKHQKPLQRSSGDMALKRPGQFRWQTKAPTHQLLLTNGNYFWIYDADLEQATRQHTDTSNESNPASLLSGSIKGIEQRFQVTDIQKPGKEKRFKLVPKDDSDIFQWIELGFVDNKLSTMKLTDKLGTLSTFSFSNVRINPPLKANLFTFRAPKGVEVLQN